MFDRRAQFEKVLSTKEDELSTHFYENPVLMVKKRKEERKRLEEINKKLRAKEERARNNVFDDEDDLFYEKKTKRFVVKDVESNDRQTKQVQKRKRTERDDYVNQMLPKEVRQMIELEEKAKATHKRRKTDEKDIDDLTPLRYLKGKGKDKTKGKFYFIQMHF